MVFLFAFLYDYSQVLRETDGSGNTIVSYTYGDDLISQDRNSSLSYFHYDGQLSTRQLTDASQTITDEYTYDAFGLLLARSGSTINDYLYTGEQYDPNVGFYYLRARYYNPTIGRFHTMDIWPGMQFEPMSLHKYLYCENNPTNSIDPSGYLTLGELVWGMVLQGIISTAIYHLINKCILGRQPKWWEYFVVFGLSALSHGAAEGGLTLLAGVKVTALGKLGIAVAHYTLRYIVITGIDREKEVTAAGFIITAVSAAIAHGIGEVAQYGINKIPYGKFVSEQVKSGIKPLIRTFIKEYIYNFQKQLPEKLEEFRPSIEEFVNGIGDKIFYDLTYGRILKYRGPTF